MDAFHGISDLAAGMIRCVGDPMERFQEDALRMLRAVRFAAQLDFRMEQSTQNAVRRLANDLNRISAERIQAELVKLVASPHPDYRKGRRKRQPTLRRAGGRRQKRPPKAVFFAVCV